MNKILLLALIAAALSGCGSNDEASDATKVTLPGNTAPTPPPATSPGNPTTSPTRPAPPPATPI